MSSCVARSWKSVGCVLHSFSPHNHLATIQNNILRPMCMSCVYAWSLQSWSFVTFSYTSLPPERPRRDSKSSPSHPVTWEYGC